MKRGRWGTEHTPFPKRFYGNALKGHTTSPTQCHYQCHCQLPLPSLEEGIQMEGKLGYNPTLQCLQDFNQARAQLESELSEEAQKLDHKYNTRQIKMERRHEQKWARMAWEGDYIFQEVFSMTSLLIL